MAFNHRQPPDLQGISPTDQQTIHHLMCIAHARQGLIYPTESCQPEYDPIFIQSIAKVAKLLKQNEKPKVRTLTCLFYLHGIKSSTGKVMYLRRVKNLYKKFIHAIIKYT